MSAKPRLSDAVYTTTRSAENDLTTTIIEALATLKGESPLELDVRLRDTIDPDALEQLFDPSPEDVGYLVFPLDDYLVSVRPNGEVTFHRTEP